jgi:pimeloyl-ACP methyl ester carboxylesterase
MRQTTTELTPAPYLVVAGEGPAVVLLHGWGADHTLFAPVAKLLRQQFRVVSLDFPGFGATPPPPGAWSVHDYAEWVIAVLASLEIRAAHFVGHSFGGRVAISIASRHPGIVHKLVLTASAGIPPQRTLGYHLRVRRFKLARRLAASRAVPAPLRRALEAQVAKAGSTDYQRAAGTVRESFVRVVNEDLRPYLPGIAAPTLLIWGDQDSDTPIADGRVMEQLIPDAALIVFAGGGHYAYLEQAGRFCHIIETFFRQ